MAGSECKNTQQYHLGKFLFFFFFFFLFFFSSQSMDAKVSAGEAFALLIIFVNFLYVLICYDRVYFATKRNDDNKTETTIYFQSLNLSIHSHITFRKYLLFFKPFPNNSNTFKIFLFWSKLCDVLLLQKNVARSFRHESTYFKTGSIVTRELSLLSLLITSQTTEGLKLYISKKWIKTGTC